MLGGIMKVPKSEKLLSKDFFNVEDSWQSDWEKVINKLYRTV